MAVARPPLRQRAGGCASSAWLVLSARVRPDGYGVWAEDGVAVPFFLEYDTGAEQLSVLTDKLAGYRDLFTSIGRVWPVLFWLHSAARERNLRHRLDQRPTMVLVVTGRRDDEATRQLSPAAPVWDVAGDPQPRLLSDLSIASGVRPRS